MSDYVTCSHCGVVKRGHKCPHRKSRQKAVTGKVISSVRQSGGQTKVLRYGRGINTFVKYA